MPARRHHPGTRNPRGRAGTAARRPRFRSPVAHAAGIELVVPSCRHFGRCGGCSQLTTPIALQLRHKVDEVEALLQPFLGSQRVQYEVPARTPQHFRTKLLYPVRKDRNGQAILGIYEPKSHDLVRISECRTQDPGLTALGTAAEQIFRDLELPPYDETTGTGFVRAFAARIAAGTGELMLGVVTRPGTFPQGLELADRLLAAARDLPHSGPKPLRAVGVVRSISDRDGNFLLGDRHVPLRGRDYQQDLADGLTFRISFGSFYQIHRGASALLYRPALDLAGPVRGQRVIDGYGGIGTFGLRTARAGAAAVEIVEDNPVACRDAVQNARLNALPVVRVVPSQFHLAEFAPGADLLIVDPPRSGLQAHGVARALAAAPRRILHIACSAPALAHDLQGLTAGGFRLAAIRLCDLFPHTDHVELATLLERST
ncbi:MAG TPA: 23S rRNA (uracil(1939)-C(5))-methyltransferase RlmD [Planctomycetota bacterium]|nr:23S rRNA (uracil(1939)-C(5))-methyltransferase RlmD [Planctomycetota bacterium]